jgi:predicted small lipoprotein YifL
MRKMPRFLSLFLLLLTLAACGTRGGVKMPDNAQPGYPRAYPNPKAE